MSLSQDICILAAWWEQARLGECEFTAEGAAAFGAKLEEAATSAKSLEALVAARQASLEPGARDGNVVHLQRKSAPAPAHGGHADAS